MTTTTAIEETILRAKQSTKCIIKLNSGTKNGNAATTVTLRQPHTKNEGRFGGAQLEPNQAEEREKEREERRKE